MCTYATMHAAIDGSGKGPGGSWRRVTEATVYFDHPVHAQHDHTVNIDLTDAASGPAERIALELSAQSARRLVEAIQNALAAVPVELADAVPAEVVHEVSA